MAAITEHFVAHPDRKVIRLTKCTLTLTLPSLQTLVDALNRELSNKALQQLTVDLGHFRLAGKVRQLTYAPMSAQALGSAKRSRRAGYQKHWMLGGGGSAITLQNGVIELEERVSIVIKGIVSFKNVSAS
jgi:hypothetical protein